MYQTVLTCRCGLVVSLCCLDVNILQRVNQNWLWVTLQRNTRMLRHA